LGSEGLSGPSLAAREFLVSAGRLVASTTSRTLSDDRREVPARMAERHETMMTPAIEGLLDRAGSKFTLVTLGSTRARQINSYFNQLGEGLGAIVPPQVTSVARKPLSIAFEEIAADKIKGYIPEPTAEGETEDEEDDGETAG
jgi:DNA-directed RNA polymerase subunit omega